MYSQYMFNTLAFNPAYAGSADVLTAMVSRVSAAFNVDRVAVRLGRW